MHDDRFGKKNMENNTEKRKKIDTISFLKK